MKDRPMIAASASAVWVARRTMSFSRAPKYWAITTVAPLPMPTKKPMSRLMKVLVQPTAANADSPTTLLMMTASAVM